jgi:hypothetical protein
VCRSAPRLKARGSLGYAPGSPSGDNQTAIKERYARQVKPGVARAQQAAYGSYLKANRVAEGINSYHMFIRWMTGAQYDRDGLPVVRAPGA